MVERTGWQCVWGWRRWPNIIAASPLAVSPLAKPAPKGFDRKIGIAMEMKIGEAFHRFRDMANPEEIRAADTEYDRLAALVSKRIGSGIDPVCMSSAVMMLALGVVEGSVRFSN